MSAPWMVVRICSGTIFLMLWDQVQSRVAGIRQWLVETKTRWEDYAEVKVRHVVKEKIPLTSLLYFNLFSEPVSNPENVKSIFELMKKLLNRSSLWIEGAVSLALKYMPFFVLCPVLNDCLTPFQTSQTLITVSRTYRESSPHWPFVDSHTTGYLIPQHGAQLLYEGQGRDCQSSLDRHSVYLSIWIPIFQPLVTLIEKKDILIF